MSDPYSTPAAFGLTQVGQINWAESCCQFDITVVWRRKGGRLVFAEAHGCPCSPPFKGATAEILRPTSVEGLHAHVMERQKDEFRICADQIRALGMAVTRGGES